MREMAAKIKSRTAGGGIFRSPMLNNAIISFVATTYFPEPLKQSNIKSESLGEGWGGEKAISRLEV